MIHNASFETSSSKISRGTMPPDPLEHASSGGYKLLQKSAPPPPPPPCLSIPESATVQSKPMCPMFEANGMSTET